MLSSVIFESKNVRHKYVIGSLWSYRRYSGLKKVIYLKNINTFKYFKVAFVSEATLVHQVLNWFILLRIAAAQGVCQTCTNHWLRVKLNFNLLDFIIYLYLDNAESCEQVGIKPIFEWGRSTWAFNEYRSLHNKLEVWNFNRKWDQFVKIM